MPTKLQLRRGSTSDHSSFTGAVGEVTIDTDKDTLVVHDGSTAGGFVVPRLSDISVTDAGGDGSLAYNNSTGVITYTGPNAASVRAHISAGNGITISSGVITLDVLDEDNFATDSATKAPSQQATKAYIASQIATKDNTDEMTEGSTNLYFTNTRADARITNALIDEDDFSSDSATKLPSQQSTKAYIASQIATKDNTDEMTEGSTNLYFTSARADARITNALLDEDNFASDSATKVASQQSIKAYVASQIATKDNTDEMTEGSTNLYHTSARVDARITAALIDEDNFSSNSATRLPSQQSVKAYVDAAVLTVDNSDEMTEGSTNLYFTNARADARISNALKDEDNMASDSATHLPSQQSVKAYVDAQTTDETAEGSSNLYFTTARVDSQIDSYLNAGTGITLAGSGAVAVNTSVIPTITAMNSAIATSISNLVDSSPDALNTLNELAAALGDDANFSTTITNSIATKAPLASAALTGTPTAPTASTGTNTTQLATTAYVKQEIDALKALLYAYDQS